MLRTVDRVTRRTHLFLATLAGTLLSLGVATGSARAGDGPPQPELSISADGCEFTFTTVNGQGANDGWSATFTVDGNDAGTWSSADDEVVLTNWISRVFAPGGTLTIDWSVFSLPDNTELNAGTDVLDVPPCPPPYAVRITKVVIGQVPTGSYSFRVWNGDEDGGTSCSATPPADAFSASVPAAGGSVDVPVSVGHYCVAEVDRRGALSTTYASSGGTMIGEWHVADVAADSNPGAPVTRVVTITNTFADASSPAEPSPGAPSPALPSTGASDAIAWFAALLLLFGALLTGGAARVRRSAP